MVELTRCLEYFNRENTVFKRSDSSGKCVQDEDKRCARSSIANGDILVSYDVSSLFTNVPLDETIQLLANRAFTNNWFNATYDLNLTKMDLVDLLSVATKGKLFQFNEALYEQTDGVALGSPTPFFSIEHMLTIRSPSCLI